MSFFTLAHRAVLSFALMFGMTMWAEATPKIDADLADYDSTVQKMKG